MVKSYNSKNHAQSNHRPSTSQLDQALGKMKDIKPAQEPSDAVERQVFIHKDDFRQPAARPKKTFFKDLGWYWKLIKPWVIFLSILEILVYILAAFGEIKSLMMDIVDPLLLVLDFIVFGHLMVKVKRSKKESLWHGLVAVFLAGFFFGLIMSVFKAFWIREFWTIFNLITEPVYMGLLAVAVGFLVGIFIPRKKI